MSIGKKSTALATLALFALVVVAGVAGPSATEVAQAEAVNTVKRAFGRLAHLSDADRAIVRENFGGDVRFSLAHTDPAKLADMKEKFGHMGYMKFDELTEEERLELKEKHKVDLEGALEEALGADDLVIIDAPEMPKKGFFGKMGRSFGMHLYSKGGDWMTKFDTNGDGDVSIEEHEVMRDEMHFEMHGEKAPDDVMHLKKGDFTAKLDYPKPVKFMQYTDLEGNKVTLGVDENDVPVMKYIDGDDHFGNKYIKFKKMEL